MTMHPYPYPLEEISNEISSSEAVSLCETLADLIAANGSKRPTINKTWLKAADGILRIDKRDPAEVLEVMAWCQRDTFWRPNIMSMAKFREKYDQLRLKREERSTALVRAGPGDRNAQVIDRVFRRVS